MIRKIGFIIPLLLVISPVWGDMYKWIEDDGSITFKDTPPPVKKKRTKVKVYSDADFAPAPPPVPASSPSTDAKAPTRSPSPAREAKPRFGGTIEMYVTEWCGYCKQAEQFMRNRNYSFNKYDIEKDSAAKQRYKNLGGRGVPLILVGSQKMSGFSPDGLERLLGN